MKLYGKQKYSMSDAARAYANNHLGGDKVRVLNGKVQLLKEGEWKDAGNVRDFAERWDSLNR